VDGVLKGPWTPTGLTIRSDAVHIGTSGSETGNFYDGKIDEVQVWDRALSASETAAYVDVTKNAPFLVGSYDMETRTSSDGLFDFGGNGHPGTAAGTMVAITSARGAR